MFPRQQAVVPTQQPCRWNAFLLAIQSWTDGLFILTVLSTLAKIGSAPSDSVCVGILWLHSTRFDDPILQNRADKAQRRHSAMFQHLRARFFQLLFAVFLAEYIALIEHPQPAKLNTCVALNWFFRKEPYFMNFCCRNSDFISLFRIAVYSKTDNCGRTSKLNTCVGETVHWQTLMHMLS